MSKWKQKARLVFLSCWSFWVFFVVAPAHAESTSELPASAVQVVPASGVQATPTPVENYEAGVKAEGKNDLIGAIALYKLAADAGYIPAQVRYANYLKRGALIEEALKYYRLSVQANSDGQYGLGAMYEEGEKEFKRDLGVARFLFSLAAEQGHRDASIRLSDAYLKGQAGLDEADLQGPEALSWIRRAAGHDYLPAMDALAVAYREGKFGLKLDPDQADVIVAITNKMRGVVVKEKKKSALFKLLKGDPGKDGDDPKKKGKTQ